MAPSGFLSFERKALKILIGHALSAATIDRVLREATSINPVVNDSGYTIETKHAELPSQNAKFELPLVVGEIADTEVRFTASIRGRTLRLRCRSAMPGKALPPDIRERDVEIAVYGPRSSDSVRPK